MASLVVEIQKRDEEIKTLRKERDDARRALKERWIGTVWGSGKAAAFEFNKYAMIDAGIENIGD